MKKIVFILLIFITVLLPLPVKAETPYTTWAIGPGGYFVRTQDAYTPYKLYDLPISAAEDMFIAPDGAMYIADTGNGQILKLKNFQVIASFGRDILKGPTGLFVDDAGTMYIADARSNTVVILDKDGNLVKQFGRPTEPLFGKTNEFLPRKLSVDKRQNIYIVSEGSVNGIIQMNTNGNFIGYFGANTSSMSLKMILQRMFLTKEQLSQFMKNVAASPSNITIDSQSLVFTVTAGTKAYQSIRRFTIAGKNIFPFTWGSDNFRDVHASENGLILALAGNGQMFEYDLNGFPMFIFGAQDTGDQRIGTLRNPVAIDRYQNIIYVLDKDMNAIVAYQETAFAEEVHTGVRLFMDGYYTEAKPYFERVLNYNGSYILAYKAIADAYFKAQDYPHALMNYKYAEDPVGYSQAFWELRNVVLQRYLSSVILGLFGWGIVSSVGKRLERRHRWFDPVRNWWAGVQKIKLVDDYVFMFRFIKQPADSFFYIKKNYRGSLLFAGLVYGWIIVVRVLSSFTTGFSFNKNLVLSRINVGNEVVVTVGALLLWNAANYLVSTISDGEGRVRDVVIGTAYSLFPYVLFALPIALISNVLTLNEVFIYNFSMNIVWFWSGLMLFIMVKEIHNYSFSETFRNVLTTLFTMALFLLTGYILYVLFGQLFDFITAIIQEIGLRG